jgi:SAM-dependent methyltransferase
VAIMTTADQEAFLCEFHAQCPAVTSSAMGDGRAPDGRSSYEILRDRVEGHARVLDLGCGDGFLLDLLAVAGHDVAGIDLSAADLALARQRPSLAGVKLLEGRAQDLPFPDGDFDACVSHMAFMLMSDIDSVAAELARVLRPGGRLALVLGGGAGGGEGYELFRQLVGPVLDDTPAERQIPPLGDRRTRHREGVDEILAPAGFSPVEWTTEPIDLGGTAEHVWSIVSVTYNLIPLDPAVVKSLEDEFLALVAGLADADGRVPCVMNLHVATTTRG